MKQKLTLFQFEQCPFCEKVRQKLKERELQFEKINVPYERDAKIRKELFKNSGVHTVPVLKVGNKYIGESEDIINFLDENF
ncbi:MAG: glutathione S-transferase N-terminal domain-containing protein [archaeon]